MWLRAGTRKCPLVDWQVQGWTILLICIPRQAGKAFCRKEITPPDLASGMLMAVSAIHLHPGATGGLPSKPNPENRVMPANRAEVRSGRADAIADKAKRCER